MRLGNHEIFLNRLNFNLSPKALQHSLLVQTSTTRLPGLTIANMYPLSQNLIQASTYSIFCWKTKQASFNYWFCIGYDESLRKPGYAYFDIFLGVLLSVWFSPSLKGISTLSCVRYQDKPHELLSMAPPTPLSLFLDMCIVTIAIIPTINNHNQLQQKARPNSKLWSNINQKCL